MYLGYNTNGLAHHALGDAIRLVHDIGYRGIAITVDHQALDPFSDRFAVQLAEVRQQLHSLQLRCVVETGARFLLDPQQKHQPTLLSVADTDRQRRIDFLKRCVDIAAELDSDCLSLWSGSAVDSADDDVLWDRLAKGLFDVLAYAESRSVAIGFEPEPGMFIDTMERFLELCQRCDRPNLKLTLDIGHLHCQGETPIVGQIRKWSDRLVNVHLEDMRRGVHEHLMFGEGEIDFPPVLAALREIGYEGGVFVELSRHSHIGPTAAQKSFAFLYQCVSAS